MPTQLYPTPRDIRQKNATRRIPPEGLVLGVPAGNPAWRVLHDTAQDILDRAGANIRLAPADNTAAAPHAIRIAADLAPAIAPEGYHLDIGPAHLVIQAPDAPGAFHAILTLAQLARARALPVVTIADAPALAVRGFMLDISRCKVPTMDTLLGLVRQLAHLRINQLQLYTEHTYAFAAHPLVWADASPMTSAELRALDAHCAAHAIELVPNLQSFRHMERWLKHAPYRHLAECPDGFFHELLGRHRQAGTLKPDRPSLDFAASLYDEYLPNFTSAQFNIGGDEPWELGRGWSAPLCQQQGRHTIYTKHLASLIALANACGKRAQFWADILLEDPERIAQIPPRATPVIWGYDAGHPFERQCATLRQTQRPYLVAPGTSSWQTFHGRLDNTLANIREATAAAIAHHAQGILATAWGDNGNHQPWWAFYPGLTAAALLAWTGKTNPPDSAPDALVHALAAVFFDHNKQPARQILALAQTDAAFTTQIRNKSILWELLFAPHDQLPALLAQIPPEQLATAHARVSRIKIGHGKKFPGHAAHALELSATRALCLAAIRRANQHRQTAAHPRAASPARDKHARQLYRRAWLARARPGGLDESLRHLIQATTPPPR